jgi:Fic family protein
MDDLVTFMNTDDLPPLMQAAIAHAQFETVHPFVDGNGRTGRAVIAMVLRRRGVATRVVPPISLVLATFADEYVGALGAFRHRGPVARRSAREAENTVGRFFAAGCARAVADAMLYERKIDELRSGWRTRLGPIRAGSATQLLVDAIPGAPVLTVGGAARLIGRSLPATNGAITRLVDAGILKQITLGRRNRAFEAADVIDAFAQLERRLASPAADTRISPPRRAVPPRGR